MSYTTQMDAARQGIITPEMEKVAKDEYRTPEEIRELVAKGQDADFAKIAKDIEERDYRDSHREISPLRQAEDATLVDSSNMTIDEVVDTIISYIEGK